MKEEYCKCQYFCMFRWMRGFNLKEKKEKY